MTKHYNCVVCNKRTKPKERRIINKDVKKYVRKALFIELSSEKDIICNKCKHKYYTYDICTKSKQNNSKRDSQSTRDADFHSTASNSSVPAASPPSVKLNIPSTPKTHARCLACKKPGPKLIVISAPARFAAFLHHNVIIPAGARCCPSHIEEKTCMLRPECLRNIPVTEQSFMNRTTILNLLKQMREMCCKKQNILDFDNIKDEEMRNLTGLSLEQFNDLFSHIKDKVKATPARTGRTSVGLLLLKLRSGMSNKLLATLFRVSKSSVRRAIRTVRQALMRSFVPLYLGLESITRNTIISQHTRPLAKHLFGAEEDEMILVLDGTYIYIQKSGNFKFQRRSYSIHKGRPLVKPMVVVTTTGYFVTIVGPFFADSKNNDAAILNHMLRSNTEDIRNFVKEKDIFVVDRGFRDSVSLISVYEQRCQHS
ncbi:uncharacterized protein LOC123531130 [Mercenaria mercenaria]|uniref:uncharacterized protein LOC123531130 n=1 Tax=Mercenaria mercenaria TaxID=6596 RepID=UPI00234E921A|nr:uncharacterized protein LOC123531130 [Mercenaria mercenaria]